MNQMLEKVEELNDSVQALKIENTQKEKIIKGLQAQVKNDTDTIGGLSREVAQLMANLGGLESELSRSKAERAKSQEEI